MDQKQPTNSTTEIEEEEESISLKPGGSFGTTFKPITENVKRTGTAKGKQEQEGEKESPESPTPQPPQNASQRQQKPNKGKNGQNKDYPKQNQQHKEGQQYHKEGQQKEGQKQQTQQQHNNASPRTSGDHPNTDLRNSKQYLRGFLFKFKEASELPPALQDFFVQYPEVQTHRNSKKNQLKKEGSEKKFDKPQTEKPRQPKTEAVQSPPVEQDASQPTELGRRAANSWMASSFAMDDKDKKARKIQSTLNKLTPENFDKLCGKLCEEFSKIEDVDLFTKAVSIVFDKAVSEPNFSTMYTNLCSQINKKLNDTKKDDKKELDLRRKLLDKCQIEFDKSTPVESAETDESREKAKKRKLGNIKFIGELFKSKLLSEKIIHDVIKLLIEEIRNGLKESKPHDFENNAELLCKLMATVGKLIDTEKAKTFIDTYFNVISSWKSKKDFSPRIKFMFQDLIELRQNKWVPRKEENNPKTISEVHEEAKRKDYEAKVFSEITLEKSETLPREASGTTGKKGSTSGGKKGETTKGGKGSSTEKVPQPKGGKASTNPPSGKGTPSASSGKSLSFDSNSPEAVEDHINSLYQEYFTVSETADIVHSIEEFKHLPSVVARVVDLGIVAACEKKDAQRELVSKLFAQLNKAGILTESLFFKGLEPLVEGWSEFKVDIPRFQEYMDKFIGFAINDGITSLNNVKSKAVPANPNLQDCKYKTL